MKLKNEFEKLVEKYVIELLKNTNYKLDFWVGDIIGGVASIGLDVYITFDEIRYCVDNNISIDKYEDYQNWVVEHYLKQSKYQDYAVDRYLRSSVMSFKNWITTQEIK